jgi:serine/threonine protein kinase
MLETPRICELHVEHTLKEDRWSRVVLCARGGRPFVLKLTRLDDAPALHGDPASASSAQRAQREAELLSCRELRDLPWVVASHGWISTKAVMALLLEFLPGGNLASLMDRTGALGHEAARFYIAQAVLALEALHAHGIAHRDVKPENLCLRASGHCALVDFGFARRFEPAKPERGMSLAADGCERSYSLLGTPEYLAPELFLREGHTPSADLWALGVTLYETLVYAMPYGGEETHDVYRAALEGLPHFPQSDFIVSPRARDLVSSAQGPGRCSHAWSLAIPPLISSLISSFTSTIHVRGAPASPCLPGTHSPSAVSPPNHAPPPLFPPLPLFSQISSLLSRQPAARPRPTDLLRHPFFDAGGFPNGQALDVAALRLGRVAPPVVPRLRSPLDVSHFAPSCDEASLELSSEISISERSSSAKGAPSVMGAPSAMGAARGSLAGRRARPSADAGRAAAPLLEDLVEELCTADARHSRCGFCREEAQVLGTSLPEGKQGRPARPRAAQCAVS